jgi:hypothetical protein
MLHRLRAEVDAGRPASGVVETPSAGVPFMRRAAVAAQLALGSNRLDRIVGDLADTVLEARRQPALGEVLVGRALMRIALSARAGSRPGPR